MQVISGLRSVLLTALALFAFVASSGAQSLADQLTSKDFWSSAHVPFSFQLGDQPSAQLIPHWDASEREDKAAHEHTYLYTDGVTRLQFEATVREYPDFPGVVDWVLHIRNQGTEDSPILDNILPLNWSVAAVPGAEALIRHAKGSDANATDFQPLSDLVTPGGWDFLGSADGFSSSRNTLPFFNLQNGNRGLIAAIGWTGNWKAEIRYARDGKTISMAAGMRRTHLRLHPGEEIRTPRIVLMAWSGGTWMDAQNQWRRLLLKHYTPQDHGAPMRGPAIFGSWGSELITDKLAYIQWVHNHHLPVDTYAVDAGWYGESFGQEHDLDNPKWKPWYTTRGDWIPSTYYYPDGLEPLGTALKRDGLGFSLWVEPETSTADRKAIQEHPDWYLSKQREPRADPLPPGLDPRLLNLGVPAARIAMTATLSDLISRAKVTWLRQDFNIGPDSYWSYADTPDRVGMTEIRHIEGLYQMWDDLLAAHPGLHIDNCASGGRRIDLETMSRSFVIWRTDYGVRDSATMQAQTTGLAPWVPEVAAFETYTAGKPWTQPGPYETPGSIYRMRTGYDTGFGISRTGDVGLENDQWVTQFNRALKEYRELQPYFYADFYPVLSYSLSDESWTGWQWDRPEQKDGIVLLMRREASPFPSMSLQGIHVDPHATYEVEFRPGYEKQHARRMQGSELTAMTLAISSTPGSMLILYRRLDSPRVGMGLSAAAR